MAKKVHIGNFYQSWKMNEVYVECRFTHPQSWGTSVTRYYAKKPSEDEIEEALWHGLPELAKTNIFVPIGSNFDPLSVFDNVEWKHDCGYGILLKNGIQVGNVHVWRDGRCGDVDKPVPSPWTTHMEEK